jgi:hypothetical protein
MMALPDVIQADNLQRLQRLGQLRYAKVNGLQVPTEEEMAIHIGDVYQGPLGATPAAAGQSTAGVAAAGASGPSKLAKAALLAATLGSGAAIPLAGSAVANWLNPPAPAAAAADPGAWQLQLVPSEPTAPTQPTAE